MATIHAITMPKWGIEMQEGTITDWHVKAGSVLDKGTPVLDVETDKIVNTVESSYAGTVRRVLASTGEVYAVGALLAVLADPAVAESDIDAFIAAFRPADTSFEPGGSEDAGTEPATETAAEPSGAARAGDGELHVSPIARRLAEKLGVDLATVTGTGPNGRISKEDVEAAAARRPGQGPGNPATRSKLSATRQSIAKRLVESKQTIPHYRLEVTVNAAALGARRAALNAAGTRVSFNDLIVRAAGLGLAQHPALNAHLEGDELVTFARADIAIAVATEQGLLTPVVRDVGALTVGAVAERSTELAARARAGTLRREDVSDGTFTVSNLGMYGLDRFDAIINPPQVAILAVGALREAPVVRDGSLAVERVVSLVLSCDHRVVDGATGAAFLAELKRLLEAPDAL